MEAVSAAAASTYSMRAAAIAADIGASLTKAALDEMSTQAALIIDSVPPPPPITTKGASLDLLA